MRQQSILIVTLVVATSCVARHPKPELKPLPKPTPKSARTGTQRPYEIGGKWYYPCERQPGYTEEGAASWYGPGFHGKATACGEQYNMNDMTAAHRTLPMNVYVSVTNESNDAAVVVRINDRGPFVKGRIIDLSCAAAKAVGMLNDGCAPVRLVVLGCKPSDNTATTLTSPGDLEKGDFFVQLGAFAKLENAMRLQARLQSSFAVKVEAAETDIGLVYRVRVGPYSSMEHARKAESQFEAVGYPDAFVIAE